MKSTDNHIKTVFAGLYAKNVQRKMLVYLYLNKEKLLVCIYAKRQKQKCWFGKSANIHIETGFAGLYFICQKGTKETAGLYMRGKRKTAGLY